MDVEALFTQLAVDLQDEGVTPGRLYGGSGLFVDGVPFACLKRDTMAFRLGQGTDAAREALRIEGAGDFSPAGDGTVEPGWVAVPVEQVSEWNRLAETALNAARG
ncbi:hypothetical protein GCM10011512_17180 [Tersicoccus solisilvae]|uniref:TfoX N-terminal domain-containing protein n=1 Tax=Tersicoccus solisilvae TaxID=1882339 RepID=A0ABQ1P443_9MICC|nr:TfoX/Sxy family protein [Tersicoccus solisilvae]GGC90715.1 hypothetical protein GCM10011512_17180 [Tersicoccus solisilvae]